MPSILDKLKDRLTAEEEPEVEENEVEPEEPNPHEAEIVARSGLEVDDLLTQISTEKGVKREEVTKSLYRSIQEGKAELVDPNPPSSFASYLLSFYSIRFWLVTAFLGVVAYSIFLMPQIYPLIYLRMVSGVLFVLYIPGYVLIEALYAKAGELDRLERLALSIGLSLALVPLVGLVLNYTPWGIRLEPIFVSLIGLTLALGISGAYRKYGFWSLARGAAPTSARRVKK